MSIPTRIDHTVRAISKLNHMWGDKENVISLVTSFMMELQEVEDTLFQILDQRSLNTAIGDQLDVIGSFVGEIRQGDDDLTFRNRIKIKIARLNSSGTPDDILSLLVSLTGDTRPEISFYYPAGYYAHTHTYANITTYRAMIENSVAAVYGRLIFSSEGDAFTGVGGGLNPYDMSVNGTSDIVGMNDGVDTLLIYDGLVIDNGGLEYLYSLEEIESGLANDGGYFAALMPVDQGSNVEIGTLLFENNDLIELDDGSILTYQVAEGD